VAVKASSYPDLPEYKEMEREQGYMVKFAHEVKAAVPGTPVIAAGRIQSPEFASNIIEKGEADLIGLATELFADPLWPKKARGEIKEPIVACEPTCSLCMSILAVLMREEKGVIPFLSI